MGITGKTIVKITASDLFPLLRLLDELKESHVRLVGPAIRKK